MTAAAVPWTGEWVQEHLDLQLSSSGDAADLALDELVGLAVRRNPRRAHLLVSSVLGKHVPVDPRLVHGSGRLLGRYAADLLRGTAPDGETSSARRLLREALAGRPGAAEDLLAAAGRPAGSPAGTVVLGYAETATALGHSVADSLGAPYLHSTRRSVPGLRPLGGFAEEHSHATGHLLLPDDPTMFAGDGPLVLVDDELSTGTTALNTIRELHGLHPRDHYVIATLVDLRSDVDRARMSEVARELGTVLDVVALAAGRVDVPDGVLLAGQQLVAEIEASAVEQSPPARGEIHRVELPWAAGAREGGRHGFTPADGSRLDTILPGVAAVLDPFVDGRDRVHVLGFEELMYAPLRIAVELAGRHPSTAVTFSTTTRSPVLPVDDPGYAIRSRLTFASHDEPDDGPGPRYAYNLVRPDDERFDAVVVVIDDAADTTSLHGPDGLLTALAGVTSTVVLAVVPGHVPSTGPVKLPDPLRGPGFGSYAADDVAWLLKDLSHVTLEAPTEEREEAIQSGAAHYAESLPIEYQPDAAYQALFTASMDRSADRLAHAVGLVTEQVLADRGPGAVLVSLARAGTPVGVLMRRWAQIVHGIDLPHHAVSIVRGRGIDRVALRWLAARHDPADVMFVDGWTGKGAIARELAASVAAINEALGTAFSPAMAVLADTGHCVEHFGTRDDFLIPSACLNSTISGLVSRTVLNDDLIGPGDFHGAKFYADLAGADVSVAYIDRVAARFTAVADAVAAALPGHLAADRTPTWDGWAAVEKISADHGIGDVNLVKPGVGETTRVLLRRVPWKILVRTGATDDLDHVRLLARARGVEVVEVADLAYSCVGLIHPGYTRETAP
jgi:hypothetical protein